MYGFLLFQYKSAMGRFSRTLGSDIARDSTVFRLTIRLISSVQRLRQTCVRFRHNESRRFIDAPSGAGLPGGRIFASHCQHRHSGRGDGEQNPIHSQRHLLRQNQRHCQRTQIRRSSARSQESEEARQRSARCALEKGKRRREGRREGRQMRSFK